MEQYKNLSEMYLKFQKKRTILTILGVALSVGVLFIILSLFFSYFFESRELARERGNYEIVLFPEQNQDISTLMQEDYIKTAYRGVYHNRFSNQYTENAIYINLKNPYKIDHYMKKIVTDYNVAAEINDDVASYYLQGSSGNETYIMLLMFLLISFILAVVGVGIIRNTIQLNTIEQIKDYGILRCVGATNGQLKSIIFRMGLIQEIAGIIVGCAFAYPIAVLIGISMNIKVKLHLITIVYILIVYIFDLFFVMSENSKIVKKITPIQAIRGQLLGTEKKIKARKPSIFGKIFGIYGDYAYKNLMSNKQRFRKNVVIFGLSIAAFIMLSVFLNAFQTMIRMSYSTYGEYPIYFYSSASDEYPIEKVQANLPHEDVLAKIANDKNVTKTKLVYSAEFPAFDVDEFRTHYKEEYLEKTAEGQAIRRAINSNKDKEKKLFFDVVQVLGYDEEEYQSYEKQLIDGTLDVTENGIVLIQNSEAIDAKYYESDSIDLVNNGMIDIVATDYKVGDSIDLLWQGKKKTFTVQGIVKEDKDNMVYRQICAIVPLKRYYEMTGFGKQNASGIKFQLKSKHMSLAFSNLLIAALDDETDIYFSDAIYLSSALLSAETTMRYVFAFTLVMLTISSFSVINTTASNLFLRRQEFAQLRAIGMSKKELKKMVIMEGVISVVFANLLGDLLGFGLLMPLAKAMIVMFQLNLSFPIGGAIVGFIISICVLCGSIFLQMNRMTNDIADDLYAAGD